MEYLAMSILAIRAVGCLVRGKNPLSTLCVLLVSNFPGILPANFCLVPYNLATKAIGCLAR